MKLSVEDTKILEETYPKILSFPILFPSICSHCIFFTLKSTFSASHQMLKLAYSWDKNCCSDIANSIVLEG